MSSYKHERISTRPKGGASDKIPMGKWSYFGRILMGVGCAKVELVEELPWWQRLEINST